MTTTKPNNALYPKKLTNPNNNNNNNMEKTRDTSITRSEDDEENHDDSDDDEMNPDDRLEVNRTVATATHSGHPPRRRDEVGEVRKLSSQDTHRLRMWRMVVTGVLLLTAMAMTLTTYKLLERQEDDNFKTAVRFSCRYLSF